jgi:methyl-accepting chemotaxis protein
MLRNLRIGTRLALGFGAIVVVMVGVAVGATLYGKASRKELATLIEAAGAKEALAADMKSLLLEQANYMRNVGLQTEVKDMQASEDRAKQLDAAYSKAIERMSQLQLGAEEKGVLETLKTLDKQIDEPFKQALALATSFHSEEAAKVITQDLDPPVQKQLTELNRLIDIQKKANRAAIDEATTNGDRVAAIVFAVQSLALLVSLLMAYLVTRSITGPLQQAVEVTSRVAAGDLTSGIEAHGRDEAAELLRSLAAMNDGLAAMVAHIRSGADSIAVGAGQVSAGNQQLSSRTEEHASSLEETASTLEEFTTTVRRNAEHAKTASQLAGTASATAERGGEVVSRVVTTMQEVTASSKRISDIIGVIDGISFQTNILALNAAVEAARAGEQGRGFAVVAAEVRSLAQRSAASAKEIRGLIEDSVGRVEAGARLVGEAGKTMDELVASVKRVAVIMTEIAAASDEQSSGIEQINKAITQMDNVVQMNASLVEEATAAAASMASQATGLARAVAQFRIDESAVQLPTPEPRAARAPAVQAPEAAGQALPEAREAPRPRREPAVASDDLEDWKEF